MIGLFIALCFYLCCGLIFACAVLRSYKTTGFLSRYSVKELVIGFWADTLAWPYVLYLNKSGRMD